jgi:hypothetical protein
MAPDELSNESKDILRRFDKENNIFSHSNSQISEYESYEAIKQIKRHSDALVIHASELKTRINEYNLNLETIQKENDECRKLMNQVKHDVGITDEAVLQELNYLKKVSSSFISSIQNQ